MSERRVFSVAMVSIAFWYIKSSFNSEGLVAASSKFCFVLYAVQIDKDMSRTIFFSFRTERQFASWGCLKFSPYPPRHIGAAFYYWHVFWTDNSNLRRRKLVSLRCLV